MPELPPQGDLILTADWVLPISSPPLREGAVHIRDGRIHAVGPAASILPGGTGTCRLDLGCAVVLPGLVNVHSHLELTVLRGCCEATEFSAWIRGLKEIKYECLDAGQLYTSALWGAVEALRAGVTTVGDTSDQGVVLRALLQSGLRGIAYHEVFGPDERDCEKSFRALVEALEAQLPSATARARVGVSPHAPYTVSGALYRRVASHAAREGLPIATHVAESLQERLFLREGTGPFGDSLRARGIAVKGGETSSIAFLERHGVLEARPLLIHAIDVDDRDLQRIANSGSAVAHCPKSNAKLGHGTAPLTEMLRLGISTGLGTDSMASNNCCDLFEEARLALFLQRARSIGSEGTTRGARDMLRLMTLGGAEALGLSGETGSLEEGKLADITAVSLAGSHQVPVHDPEAALVFSTGARDVLLTLVGGRVLFDGGKCLSLDEEALRCEITEVARIVQRETGKRG